ncbi:MAG: hypothetical protein ACRD7E_18095, partial [Bryobacteraceae bacterium]
LQGVLEFAPGVLATPAASGEAGQFSANGQRPNTNYFTVDGVSANNGVSGGGLPGGFSGGALPGMTAIGSLHGLVSLADLQEVRVQTSTLSPEYGRLPGAQVAVITRSGSNGFHGELFGGVRPEGLSASDWFASRAALPRRPSRLTTAGGQLTGPILRNRTFFSASSEWLRLRQTATWRSVVPSVSARLLASGPTRAILDAFPVPNGRDLGDGAAEHTAQTSWPARVSASSVRLDQALSGAGTLFVRYSYTPSVSRSGLLQVNEARLRSGSLTIGAITALGSSATNDVRVNVSRASVESSWLAQPLDLSTVLPPLAVERKVYGLSIGGMGRWLSGDGGRSRQSQWNLINTLAFTRGRHQLRLGVDYQRLNPVREEPLAGVAGVYANLTDLLEQRTPMLSYSYAGSGSSLIETFSGFIQDTWRFSPRLNITFGTRWELTPAPSFRVPAERSTGLPSVRLNLPVLAGMPQTDAETLPGGALLTPIWRTRYNQFAPRVGAAYLLDREGSLVLRAGAGLFYDLGFSSSTDILNGAPYNRWLTTFTAGIANLSATEILYGFAPDLRLPYSLQWNVTLERAFRKNTVVSAGYVGSAGRRLLRRETHFDDRADQPRIVLATNNGASDYHSLQIQARRRVARGLRGVLSYAWAHSIDNGSWDSASYLVFPGRPQQDRGPANFDVRHSLQVAMIYDIRPFPAPALIRSWTRNWTISAILRSRTGFPVDVLTEENAFGLAFDNASRPDVLPGAPLWIEDGAIPGGHRLNPDAFAAPPDGEQGNLGRNSIRGFGLTQIDLALQRRFTLPNDASLQIRLEAYNMTNRPNFADPARFLSSALFGQPLSLTNLMLGTGRPNSGLSPAFQPGGPRALQMGMRLTF